MYNIKITKREQDKRAVLDLQFLIDGEEKANIYGLSVDDKEMNIFVQTWNLNNYQEPLIDRSIKVDELCPFLVFFFVLTNNSRSRRLSKFCVNCSSYM